VFPEARETGEASATQAEPGAAKGELAASEVAQADDVEKAPIS
jgi:hypothetical protein